MAAIKRRGQATWWGTLKGGKGEVSTESGALKGLGYSFSTRFENEPGTNPEELIAGAHAACYSMAFSATLEDKGYTPKRIETHATCVMTPQEGGGFAITEMQLKVRGEVPGLDNETFVEIAHEADESGCPVSKLLRPGLTIKLDAALA
jgi:osmotically inducible protein OsmC